MFNEICINHKNGTASIWTAEEFTEYTYVDHCFVVIKNGAWVGIYNMDDVDCVVVR